MILIALYLTYAFWSVGEHSSRLSYAFVTIVTLMHDVIVSLGIFILLGYVFPILKVESYFVAAVLTIIGYSINDTIVILDRIRTRLRVSASDTQKKKTFE